MELKRQYRSSYPWVFSKNGYSEKLLCGDCIFTYYGETERDLNVNVTFEEHLSLFLTGKRVNNSKKSAVKDHWLFFNHVGSFVRMSQTHLKTLD